MNLIASLFLIVMVDTDDGRRTTPGVWHKLPTGELKNINTVSFAFSSGIKMILWIFPKIVKLYSKTLADNRYISIIYTNLDKLSNKITDTVQMQVKVILGIMV